MLLLDNDNTLSTGSRAICFAKRTLEIFDRLGVGDAMCAKGVTWNVGQVFFGDEQLYSFNLLPEPGHERPAFINLQQYYAEDYLAERAAELPNLDLRWKNKVVGVEQDDDGVPLGIDTPEGRYTLRRRLRGRLRRLALAAARAARPGEQGPGVPRPLPDRRRAHEQRSFPAERWFWFDPPFHPNQSVLLHMQPDDVWRIDFQLGWDADPERRRSPSTSCRASTR